MDLKPSRVSLLLLAFCLAGCVRLPASPNASNSPTATPTPSLVETQGLDVYFENFDGAFALLDLKANQIQHYNPQRCTERLLPASTYKILNALIGLETGVIPDENYVIPWDGTPYPVASWNQDHTLKTAIQNSVVWVYQELARRVGRERMQYYVQAVGYGNQDLSGPIDTFWLDGTLKISADEQINFLRRLVQGDLPFSSRSMEIVRSIIVLDQNESYQLSGKTGSGQMNGRIIGWFLESSCCGSDARASRLAQEGAVQQVGPLP